MRRQTQISGLRHFQVVPCACGGHSAGCDAAWSVELLARRKRVHKLFDSTRPGLGALRILDSIIDCVPILAIRRRAESRGRCIPGESLEEVRMLVGVSWALVGLVPAPICSSLLYRDEAARLHFPRRYHLLGTVATAQ